MPLQTSEAHQERVARTPEEIRAWIVQEVARVLKVAPARVDAEAPLVTLGVASIDTFGLTGALAEWLNRDLPATLMWDYPTIQAIAEGLADRPAPAPASWPGVIPLQPVGDHTPIFFFPGQLGHPATFTPLALALGTKHPCYGLTIPGLDGKEKPYERVEQIAAAMLTNLRRVQPHGPYQLAGYSFGGLLAYEAARQLSEQGETIATLAIYDTFNALGKRRRPVWQRVGLYFYLLATQYLRPAYLRDRWESRRRRAEKKMRLAQNKNEPVDPAVILRAALEAVNIRAVDLYHPKPFDGSLVFFRATKRSRRNIYYRMDPTGGWSPLAQRGVRVIEIPGNHLNILSAERATIAAEKLAAVLQ